MHRVLVTGGAGFIGSNFVRYLLAAEPQVTVVNLDALTYAGSLENLRDLPDPARHVFIHGSICDRPLVDDLFQRYAIDTVVHFAAETHVDRSILSPADFIHTNVVGTFTLLEAARQAWLADVGQAFSLSGRSGQAKSLPYMPECRFHHVSTDEVYGALQPGDPAFTESTPYAPNSPYAASKASSDHLVRAYFHTYGLPVSLTNCSNNYGPYQFPEKLIPLIILNAASGRPLPVYGDGLQVRDWLYVEDHCEAILKVIKFGRLGETYNVGGNNQPANIAIIRMVCAILDDILPASLFKPHTSLITHVTDRPGHDRRYDINIAKIQRELGWQPRQSLESGLRRTVEWYLQHPDWVAAVYQHPDFQQWVQRNYSQRGETP
jgi:dTDP-glucose 4,6-dehydratase